MPHKVLKENIIEKTITLSVEKHQIMTNDLTAYLNTIPEFNSLIVK